MFIDNDENNSTEKNNFFEYSPKSAIDKNNKNSNKRPQKTSIKSQQTLKWLFEVQLPNLQSQIESKDKEVIELKADISNLQRKICKMSKHRKHGIATISEMEATIELQKRSLEEKDSEINRLQNMMNSTDNSIQIEIDHCANQIHGASYENESSVHDETFQQIQNTLAEMERDESSNGVGVRNCNSTENADSIQIYHYENQIHGTSHDNKSSIREETIKKIGNTPLEMRKEYNSNGNGFRKWKPWIDSPTQTECRQEQAIVKFPCPNCEYVPKRKYTLKKHQNEHCKAKDKGQKAREKDKMCSICFKPFTHDGLRTHLRGFINGPNSN